MTIADLDVVMSPDCLSLRWGLSGLHICGKDALGYYFALVVLTCGVEAQTLVEAFRAILTEVVGHG
jgi:hypothetical protein